MLFNSYEFILIFLPVTLLGFFLFQRFFKPGILPFLLVASLFFYGWWSLHALLFFVASIVLNYVFSLILFHKTKNRFFLWGCIIFNMLFIVYFKYAFFIVDAVLHLKSVSNMFHNITLPLAISFFTFQQIAYLVDVWRGEVVPQSFMQHALFVAFFPQLIAGPIMRYQELVPQFNELVKTKLVNYQNVVLGLTLFFIGLFKKTGLADSLMPYVKDIYSKASAGYEIGVLDSWAGALAYTFQLYFDFSGYSDMALGLGVMFGILIPMNFNSPYKSTSIIEFWRRWHITLSNFFKNYIYFPLGGSRKGIFRKFFNLFLVMTLVGIWHGAGYTFLLWGVYHGVLLIINHMWLMIKSRLNVEWLQKRLAQTKINFFYQSMLYSVCWLVTFFLVVLGWVMFRAENLSVALKIYQGMFNQYGFLSGGAYALIDYRNYYTLGILLVVSFGIILLLPNSVEYMKHFSVVPEADIQRVSSQKTAMVLHWKLEAAHAVLIGFLVYFSMVNIAELKTEFLYFNF